MSIEPLLKDKINSIIELFTNGQKIEALETIKTLADKHPNESLLQNINGVCYKETGQLELAVKCFEKALVIKPDFADAHYNLGLTFQELNQIDAAVKSYKETLLIQSNYAQAHNNLGIIYKELGKTEDAIKSYEQVIILQPDNAEAHHNLGNALNELGRLDEAIKSYEQALSLQPNYYEIHNNLGSILHEIGQTDRALNSYKEALSINPNFADAHNNLGNILKELGQTDEAFNCYVQALAASPNNAQIHRNFGMMKHYKEGDTQLSHMQSLLSTNNLSNSDRSNLCFALAKAYEDLEMKDELFKALNEGNKLRKQELNYSIEKDLNKHAAYYKVFKSNVKESTSYKPADVSPIFIVGMPRSGTTLVEQITSSHHKVHGAGELSSLNNLIAPIMSDNLTPSNALSEKNLLLIRQGYLNNLSNLNVSESIITDKMPTNFENIGFILKAFPEAKIIHLKRDAMAICWSIYQRHFPAKGLGFPYDMQDLAKFYNSYTEMMTFWHELFPNQIYDISYENLTTNQEEETRKLLQYCELEWDENCLNFHTNKRAVKTTSSMQVRKKMYQGSSNAWRKYEEQLKPLIKALGYS